MVNGRLDSHLGLQVAGSCALHIHAATRFWCGQRRLNPREK